MTSPPKLPPFVAVLGITVLTTTLAPAARAQPDPPPPPVNLFFDYFLFDNTGQPRAVVREGRPSALAHPEPSEPAKK